MPEINTYEVELTIKMEIRTRNHMQALEDILTFLDSGEGVRDNVAGITVEKKKW